jgi:hypothetical protein
MAKNRFPTGWDQKRVERVLEHYENQSEEEAVAEDEAAFTDKDSVFVEVPRAILGAVRKLIAAHQRG